MFCVHTADGLTNTQRDPREVQHKHSVSESDAGGRQSEAFLSELLPSGVPASSFTTSTNLKPSFTSLS